MKDGLFNALVYRISNGDMSAVVPIYNEYFKKLQVVAIRILKNKAAAEGAASQAFTDFINDAKNGKVGKVVYVSGYLCTRCKNVALKMKVRNNVFVDIENIEEPETADLVDSVIGNADLSRAMSCLKDAEREICLMFFVYGYKIKEISKELDMPDGTVKWHIKNIKKKISEFFT